MFESASESSDVLGREGSPSRTIEAFPSAEHLLGEIERGSRAMHQGASVESRLSRMLSRTDTRQSRSAVTEGLMAATWPISVDFYPERQEDTLNFRGTVFLQILDDISSLFVPISQLKSLQARYAFRDSREVVIFLKENPALLSLLFEIHGKLREYLSFSQIFLYVFRDPDSDNDRQLVVSILPDIDPLMADMQLQRFDEEWWLDNLDRAGGKVCITLEFR